MGVKFDSTVSRSAKPDAVLDRLKKLWLAKRGTVMVANTIFRIKVLRGTRGPSDAVGKLWEQFV